MPNLTQKERSLLEDQKKQEALCIKKYQSYANQAQDPQLSQLFASHAQQEQQHLDSINQLLNGQIPSAGGQQNQQSNQNAQQSGMQQSSMQQGGMQQSTGQNAAFPPLQSGGSSPQNDADLCEDLLSTEKYVSSAYNTAIFEFRDPAIRQELNHIQKEEQQHGKLIYDYMKINGMYS